MPTYLDQKQALAELEEMGISLTARQMKRATEPNIHGKRKLPFFIDPIDGRLKISRDALVSAYFRRQAEAEKNALR